MLFWTLIALLTAAAILAVLVPLGRPARAADSAVHARQVYLDQLKELARDMESGRLSPSEAEAARAEIARRLIAVDGEARAPANAGGSPFARRAVSLLALAGIPALSLSLYLALGAPFLPGAPLAARIEGPGDPNDFEAMIGKVERHLAEHPEDGQGWEVIAPVYLRLGRADDAVRAYGNTIRLLGSTPDRQTKLGEAIWTAEGGIVTAEARAAFEAANALDGSAPEPRFFLALAAKQAGDEDEARERLTALLNDSAADAPWRRTVEAAIADLDGEAQPGPSAEQVAAAGDMAPADRTAMIERMVGGLAARLKDEPDDVEGWLRLIRSYVVLGRSDDASEAASAALAGVGDVDERKRVEALIADLGVTPAAGAMP